MTLTPLTTNLLESWGFERTVWDQGVMLKKNSCTLSAHMAEDGEYFLPWGADEPAIKHSETLITLYQLLNGCDVSK
jgi:hypothetical protein